MFWWEGSGAPWSRWVIALVRSIFEIQHEFCEARRYRDTPTGYRAMRQ